MQILFGILIEFLCHFGRSKITYLIFLIYEKKLLISCFQIEPLENESNVVRHIYELIEYYGVPTPPEDIAVFQVSHFFYISLNVFHLPLYI